MYLMFPKNRYNDQAVLENFHAASLFQLLRQRPDLNIFASLPRAKFKEVRKIIIECIIATDPAVHYEYVSKLAGKVKDGRFFSVFFLIPSRFLCSVYDFFFLRSSLKIQSGTATCRISACCS